MTRKKLKDIITDHICFDEEESKLNSLIEDIMSELIAELNPPAAPKPRTADGVDVKDGDRVWVVDMNPGSHWYQIAPGKAIITGNEVSVVVGSSTYAKSDRFPIFSSFHAACKHIATLLGVETAADLMTLNPNHSEFDQRSSDAAVWAKAFCDYFPGHDEGTMIGWFANAMVAAMDHSKKQIELGRQIGAECAKSSAESEPMVPVDDIVFDVKIRDAVIDVFDRRNVVWSVGLLTDILIAIRSQIDARGKAGEDDGWVGEHFDGCGKHWWIGKNGMCSDLSSVKPYETNVADRFIESHLIPLSEARKIEEERLRKEGGK